LAKSKTKTEICDSLVDVHYNHLRRRICQVANHNYTVLSFMMTCSWLLEHSGNLFPKDEG